jgi:hypothetical protein
MTIQKRQQIFEILTPFIAKQWVFVWNDQSNPTTIHFDNLDLIRGFRLQDPEGLLYSNQILSTLFAAFPDSNL